ncbi:MAG: flagellar basal body P-ring formation chaperone FlgA [bacterium]
MNTRTKLRFFTIISASIIFAFFAPSRSSASQILNSGWLLETAKNVILTTDPWMSAGCSVEIANTANDISVWRDGKIEVKGILERVPNGLKDVGAVSVEIYTGGQLYMRFNPSPYLAVTLDVFTASRSIGRGEVLTENDIAETPTDVKSLPAGDVFSSIDEIVGLVASQNIQEGKILQKNLVEMPILVSRGDKVTVIIAFGDVAITLTGTAIDSGSLGDEIRIRNPDSGKIITATVTGESKAEIKISG